MSKCQRSCITDNLHIVFPRILISDVSGANVNFAKPKDSGIYHREIP